MARKRVEEQPAGSPAWMTTFSDLMNLLLCFFVLLFAMSNIDEDKFEELVASLSASFGVLDGGSTSVIEGTLISAGVDNLNELDEYYESIGLNDEGQEEAVDEDIYEYAGEQLMEVVKDKAAEASEQMAEEIKQMAQEQEIADRLDIDFNSQYVTLTLNGALLFDSAKSKLVNSLVVLAGER